METTKHTQRTSGEERRKMKNEITVNLKIKDGEQLISKIEEAMEHLKKTRDIIAWDLSKKIQVEMEPSTNKADDSEDTSHELE